MKIALLVLAVFFIVATALPFIREPYWWVRMFDFPRAQLAFGGIVTLGLFVLFYQRGEGFFPRDATWLDYTVLVLLALSVLYQVARMAPYTIAYPVQAVEAEQATEDRSLRLVVSNVLMDNREAERWLAVIRAAEPDVVLALETDAWWAEAARPLEEEFPYTVKVPQDNTYGLLVLSRWPLHDFEVRHLVEDDVPSLWGEVELPSGERVACVFIHPRPPRPDIAQDSDARDAELVLVARAVEEHPGPLLVAGDLNDVAWSRTTRLFQEISGLLDPRIGRGLFATFHADYFFMRWPLDHVFHSDDLLLAELRRLDHVGSDHFPMLIELAYQPENSHEQVAPDAEADDREEAEEILDDAARRKAEETPEERRERRREDR